VFVVGKMWKSGGGRGWGAWEDAVFVYWYYGK
jgi:hypothetical protein